MDIPVISASSVQKKNIPTDEDRLGFGNYFSDHMFMMRYNKGDGWYDPRIIPFGDLTINPAAMGLHYGQEIFEGLKAYKGFDGGINLFRPRDNYKRLNRSAARLCMPEIDIDAALDATRMLVSIDRDWIPSKVGASLYIRPVMLAIEPHIGVRPSSSYLFYIITGPVGPYYKEGMSPIKIFVESEYVRASPGGVGEAKTAANYAASLFSAERAKERGFSQVLWLDAREHRYIEEVGTMNIFFVFDHEVITPPLSGSILPGITRDSVIRLAQQWGIKFSERQISIEQVMKKAKDGSLREVFGTGTAAVISPVGGITYKNTSLTVADGKIGKLSQRLYNEIVNIQYNNADDPFGWREKIE